ncbi:MAG: hypothetical protein ABJC13_13900 [Acidobacteriota bacterium]
MKPTELLGILARGGGPRAQAVGIARRLVVGAGRVVQRNVENRSDAALGQLAAELLEQGEGLLGLARDAHRVADPVIVGDVVAVRAAGREDRRQPDRVDPQLFQMVEVVEDALQVAARVVGLLPAGDFAVVRSVAVGEHLDRHVINDPVVERPCRCGARRAQQGRPEDQP